MGLIVYCRSFEVALEAGPDVADVTGEISRIVAASGISEGLADATVIGSTGSLTTIEYEAGAVEDFKHAIERLAPPGIEYAHELAWHDGNGHSHVQAALMGPSLVLPVRGGNIRLGTWQQAILVNHDARARHRTVEITVLGQG